jgi:hypothetical protein
MQRLFPDELNESMIMYGESVKIRVEAVTIYFKVCKL